MAISSTDILGQAQAWVPFSSQSSWKGQVLGSYPSPSTIGESGIHGTVLPSGETLRLGKVVDPANTNRMAIQFQLAGGDPITAGSHRAEIWFASSGVPIINNQDYWVAFSVYVPGSWSDSVEESIFGSQMHYSDSLGGLSPAWALTVKTGQMYFSTRTSSSNSNGTLSKRGTRALPKNQWLDFVVKFRMSQDSTGYFKAWVNGESMVDYSGALGIPGTTSSTPGYMKFGYYGFDMPSSGSARKILMRSPVIVLDAAGKYSANDLLNFVRAN